MTNQQHQEHQPADLDVVDMVAELTRPHAHAEGYRLKVNKMIVGRRHQTRVPSLIHQLQHASPSGEGVGRSGAYESRPVARVEALDALVRIDLAAARWIRELGEDDPGTTIDCVTLLGSLLPSADRCKKRRGGRDCCTAHAIEHDIRRWYAQARVVTGWDTAPWRPDATCPLCGVRGSLRIRLEDRAAVCADCHETWDSTTYQELAGHIRAESMARRRAASTDLPCMCPVEQPWTDMAVLCTRCGTSTCIRAVERLYLIAMDIHAGATTTQLVTTYGLRRSTALRLVQEVRYPAAS